jgi:WhiB family redox-sensing transcriptional regulator
MGDWRSDAACAGDAEPNDWFASREHEPEQHARAAALCRSCPVQVECADYALSMDLTDGLWGGLSGADLRDLGAVHRRSDAWAEQGVRDDVQARRRAEAEWRRSLPSPARIR